MTQLQTDVIIIGAGPTGLTAAHELDKLGLKTVILEKLALVGGIARTENYKGYGIDIGGHRFYTQVPEVTAMWQEILGADFLHRPRLSRIYYNQRYFNYPLRLPNVLTNLGLTETWRVLASYLTTRLNPYPYEDNFQEWVSNRFGRRLFELFFKSYTEKVWGLACTDIKAEWAAQRIKDLSLITAVTNALWPTSATVIKSLIDSFDYPRRGPGMLWERLQAQLTARQHTIILQSDVIELCREGTQITDVVAQTPHGLIKVHGRHVISSMPLGELIAKINPPPPPEIQQVAQRLTYRDFLTVALVVKRAELFPDNWLYIHNPNVQVGRIQNFKNWSPEMIPPHAPETSCVGLEYFCNEGDALWQKSEADLIALARTELVQLGLVKANEVIDGVVYRQPKAYPIYTGEYKIYLQLLKLYLNSLTNLQTAGRNGLHRYNNQDHSMLTAMLAVKNIMGESHDLWTVNTERSYYEEIQKTT